MTTHPVCFIDTETLGLDADFHMVWEVGLILPDGAEHEWQVEVSERALNLAHPKALEISAFHARYNKSDATPADEVCRLLYRLIPEGSHLAGAVVSFDEERLRRMMWTVGLMPPWHYHVCDVETLAAGKLGIPPPWDSNELSRAVGVEPERFARHTALGDARWAKAIYEAVLGPVSS